MNVKVESLEKNVVQLEIEVDATKFEEGMQKSFLKNANKFAIPGFRKGKAPRKVVERYYGAQVLYEDAINIVCPEVYEQAVEQQNIYPVDKPEIDIKQIGDGQNFVFTAKVTTKPEVELGEYKGVEVNKIEAKVTDEDVEKELQKVAEKNARMVTIDERGVQSGDIAVIDFEGFIDGVPFEGGSASDYSLEVGLGHFIPGFEDQLIGALTGDTVEVNVTFPEDYNNEEVKGKPALFKVRIKEIKVKELPVLDDEFAKDVSEFDTLEAYKEDLKNKLVHDAEHKAEHETEDSIINKIVENAAIDVPAVMVEKQIDNLARDFDMRLRYQGLDLQKYLNIMGMDYASFREQFYSRAEKDVRTQMVIEKVGQVEKVTASDEEFEEEIKKIAGNINKSEEEFKKQLSKDDIEYIKGDLIFKNTIKFLVDQAKIV